MEYMGILDQCGVSIYEILFNFTISVVLIRNSLYTEYTKLLLVLFQSRPRLNLHLHCLQNSTPRQLLFTSLLLHPEPINIRVEPLLPISLRSACCSHEERSVKWSDLPHLPVRSGPHQFGSAWIGTWMPGKMRNRLSSPRSVACAG